MTTALPYRLERTVLIRADRAIVFSFFTNSDRWASWWGAGSRIDARPGGQLLIRHPNAVEASGEVVEVNPPERIVFTYGYANGKPSPPGSSRVTIRLEPAPRGTLLHLVHDFADLEARDEHVQGWRYQLSVFANVVTNHANANASAVVDAWFRGWSEPDKTARDGAIERATTADVAMVDRFSLLDGRTDLLAHLDAIQRFMPGIRLERLGEVRHCQGTLLADWVARGKDGNERGRGTNVFTLAVDGRIATVTGFWN
jgi:uncharacterized protein YndB with AHSA1/START domain